MELRIVDIKINNNRRVVNKEKVLQLADSIKEIGLLNPVNVTNKNELIAGLHRVEAFKLLGRLNIPCNISGITDPLKLELAEIDENLIRNEVHFTIRGDGFVRRDEILLELGLRATQANKGNTGKYKITGDNVTPVKTTADIAKEMGVSERTMQREKQISRSLSAPTKELIREKDISKADAIKLAALPKEKQEIFAEKLKEGAKSFVDARRIIAKENVKKVEPIKGKYRVFYADPPWQYGDKLVDGYGPAENHYPTMSIQQLCNMPIIEASEETAVLFIWTTSPLLEETFKVINAWGFKYKSSFVWNKEAHNMGHYNSVRHEFLLICTKGSCTPDNQKLFNSVQSIKRTKHSEKPEEFRKIIETLYEYGNKIELFARSKKEGWESWGNQCQEK